MDQTNNQVNLPLAALAVGGQQPAKGDTVEAAITGQVVAISGESATVRLTAVNDQPVPAAPDAAGDLDENQMRLLAARADGDAEPEESDY
jgi:hypothetical protein